MILLLLLISNAHAESCELQYDHAKTQGVGKQWCHDVVKPDLLAGSYCLTYDGPLLGPLPSPVPSVKTPQAFKAALKAANPSVKHGPKL